jgi:hypothetical protein
MTSAAAAAAAAEEQMGLVTLPCFSPE